MVSVGSGAAGVAGAAAGVMPTINKRARRGLIEIRMITDLIG
jgi:hypothetical protein